MPDPSSTLRQMVQFDAEFDLAQVRTLCLMITAGMLDQEEAARMQQKVVDELILLEGVLSLTDGEELIPGYLREDAVAAVERVIRKALG